MTTVLTAAHKTWRAKVFIATWLSYVGFYFCRKPFSAAKNAIGQDLGWSTETLGNVWAAYLIAYAIGQFLASGMGTKLGPRKNVLLGMGLSVCVTLAMGITVTPMYMAGLAAINGIAQATGWSGNVGTMASWFHKHERGRVMGMWSTNFTTGALTSGWVMGAVLDIWTWQSAFFTGAGVLSIVWLQFFFLQRNRPEDVGLSPVDDPLTAVDESKVPEPTGSHTLSRDSWINLLLVGGFYFCAKLIRYAIWSWAAYFLANSYKLTDKQANIYSTVFEIGGLFGVFATGWMSDRFFRSRRAGASLIMMIAMTGCIGLLIATGGTSVPVFIFLLGLVGFSLYGPDALLSGAGAMDIGGRNAATFATGVIAGFGALGPIVQELVIARMYDAKGGDLTPVLILLFVSAAVGSLFCVALVLRNRSGGKGI
jgi:OPA family sugar phosphate sensor protein UhpC-like MFS transporter